MGFRIEGSALVALLAPWAIAACGSTRPAGSTPQRDGGGDGGNESLAPTDASTGSELEPLGVDVTLPSASAFADVNVGGDFTQPVDLPPPATAISGDSASLVGSWVQLASDGSLCTSVNAPVGTTCFHLDIRQDDAGAVEGTIHGDVPDTPPPPKPFGPLPPIVGPFPPATDPSVGYPPNLSPSDYLCAEQWVANVDYPILDGVVMNGSFKFWFSPLDLWSAWCALQTPYAWNVGGATKYRCVPQTATETSTDVGKFALCTSAYEGPQCTDNSGSVVLCGCLVGGDGGMYNGSLPTCGPNVCDCSATQCRANLRGNVIYAALTVEAGKLVGVIQIDEQCGLGGFGQADPTITFQRATQ